MPSAATDEEIEVIESAKLGLNVTVMDTRRTAYGNMVLANDKGAVVDPRLTPETMTKISTWTRLLTLWVSRLFMARLLVFLMLVLLHVPQIRVCWRIRCLRMRSEKY